MLIFDFNKLVDCKKTALKSAVFFCCLLCSCAGIPSKTPRELRESIVNKGRESGFSSFVINTDQFDVFALRKISRGQQLVRVYIEGDGAPWPTFYTPPKDPTPIHSLVADIAFDDLSGGVVYLGRPCQYLLIRNCDLSYWTHRRFSSEVIKAYDYLLDSIKKDFGVKSFELIGYSGGGVVAALLAFQRRDVSLLVTIAAPLDTKTWVDYHGLSPLLGINPADIINDNFNLKRIHWFGGSDQVVPVKTIRRPSQLFNRSDNVFVVENFDHVCCWREWWRDQHLKIGK